MTTILFLHGWHTSIVQHNDLDGGSWSVGSNAFENIVPYSLEVHRDIGFSAVNLIGERLVINGIRITVEPVGNACYIEQFPGNK